MKGTIRTAGSEEGFTIVELAIVLIISVIILAGMAVLVTGAFGVFNKSRDLEAITDSSRRALASMSRQLKMALHFVNAECTEDQVSFYADIDNDEGATADVNSGRWNLTDKVVFLLSNGKVTMRMTDFDVDPVNPLPDASLGSHAASLKFYYFARGVAPTGEDPFNPDNNMDPATSDINKSCGMIRIVVRFTKGDVSRIFHQDVFLRILVRQD